MVCNARMLLFEDALKAKTLVMWTPVTNLVMLNSDQHTVLYLETSVLLESIQNSVNPKDPISVKTL